MNYPPRGLEGRTRRLSLALALTATVASSPALAAQVSPTPAPVYPELQVAGILDYDDDGIEELLGTEARTGQLGAYRVDPFGRPILVRTLADVGFALQSVISADMDGDGLNDLVGIGGLGPDGTIVVFYDRGGDRFEPYVSIAQTNRANQLVATDFDADGRQDLAVYPTSELLDDPQGTPDTIRLIRNLGGGTFDTATSILSFPEALRNAAALDLDQDGDVDFAAIRPSSGTLVVGRNTGTLLQLLAIPGTEQNIQDLAVGDVNSDGIDDVVTLRTSMPLSGPATVDVYFGVLGGTLSPPMALLSGQAGTALDVSLLDVDGDGALDIVLPRVITVASLPSLLILKGNGAGGFAAPIFRLIGQGTQRTRSYAGDLNSDGRDDLIQGIERSSSSTEVPVSTIIFFGSTDASGPVLAEETPLTASIDSGRFATGDLNGDGITDLAGRDGKGLVGLLGLADSQYFHQPRGFFQAPANFQPLILADLNQSGRDDVIGTSTDQAGVVTLGVMFTTLAIQGSPYVEIDTYQGGAIDALRAVDWDSDGDLDLVGAGAATGGIEWYENLGSGVLAAPSDIPLGSTGAVITKFLTADFNADGHADLAVNFGVFNSELAWFAGTGNGLVGPRQALNVAAGPMAAADLDKDGFDDLVYVSADAGIRSIRKFAGSSTGLQNQTPQLLVADVVNGTRLEIANIDGSEALDLVMLNANGSANVYLSVFLFLYDSTPIEIMAPLATSSGQPIGDALFSVTDIGGDGDADIVVGSELIGVLWQDNKGLGSIGNSYCGPAVPNSIGGSGRMLALGSNDPFRNNVQIHALDLPPLAFGMFLASQTATIATPAAGSIGTICLGGQIGRFVGPGEAQDSGWYGRQDVPGAFSLRIDLTSIPSPLGFVGVTAGSTWNFQAWHRDTSPMGATSNFTDAVSVTF